MNPSRAPRSRITQDRWLVSYSDFITLLFAFFVVLYAFSKASQRKQVLVSHAIGSAFHMSVNPFEDDELRISANSVIQDNLVSPAKVRDDLEHMRRELEMALGPQIANRSVGIRMDREGLVISLREAGFFDSGSAYPRPESHETLRQIAASLIHTPYDLRVEGHTDNVPIHSTEFDSNWELSTARATHVARILLALDAIPANHLSASGYAEYHPVASNDTPEGRSQNRRVDIVVLPRTSVDLSAAASTPPTGPWKKITDR